MIIAYTSSRVTSGLAHNKDRTSCFGRNEQVPCTGLFDALRGIKTHKINLTQNSFGKFLQSMTWEVPSEHDLTVFYKSHTDSWPATAS